MAERTIDRVQRPLNWFIKLCKMLWKQQPFFWGIIILDITLCIVVAWLLSGNNRFALEKLPVGWLFENPSIIIAIVSALILFTIITYLGSLYAVDMSDLDKDLERRYLKYMIRSTDMLTFRGFPVHLIVQSVPLDEVFIPLHFRLNRSLADYPLTERELRDYRDRLKKNIPSSELEQELERFLFDTQKVWFDSLEMEDKISIGDLWKHLSKELPVAVILGSPGMGKSTLLARLTLYMARCCLNSSDPMRSEHIEPFVIPILLSIKDYATEYDLDPSLSLSSYLELSLKRLDIPDLAQFLKKRMKLGRCLVMFDGLDEVSDRHMRILMQEEIKRFILNQRDTLIETNNFNRFLITSRIAGYDQTAFPDYLHYTIAELTMEQIEGFISQWYLATLLHNQGLTTDISNEEKKIVTKEAAKRAKFLSATIKRHQGVYDLARNPLLLTLLTVMQQNSIEISKQRSELYSVITRMLLENRSIVEGLPPIPEELAIQRLGPLAYRMQAQGNSFARQSEVVDLLKRTIAVEGSTPNEINNEAQSFFNHVRERGIFVQRAGDYYSFLHRTFQEYFVARYVLNRIYQEPSYEKQFVDMVLQDDLWREPFLLAVAYESSRGGTLASKMIARLLGSSQDEDSQGREHALLLAAQSLIETKPLSIHSKLEAQIAEQILVVYEQLICNQRFDISERFEDVVSRWLQSIPRESYRPPLLTVLQETISGRYSATRQCATLTLLIMISQQLVTCSDLVFDKLIPPLLAQLDLPSIGRYKTEPLLTTTDLHQTTVDLVSTALAFMGKRGPNGSSLTEVYRYFAGEPDRLRLLARYSLESRTLLLPTIVPQNEDNYQDYELAIGQWLVLRNQHRIGTITEKEMDTCLNIFKSLLYSAEEVYFLSSNYVLKMLQSTKDNQNRPWEDALQGYLAAEMASGKYINFQEASLLWMEIFPKQQELNKLARLLLAYFSSSKVAVRRCTQRFIAMISNDLQNLRNLQDMLALRNIRDITYLRDHYYLQRIQNMWFLRNLQKPQELRKLQKMQGIQYLRNERNLQGLRNLLLTHEIAEQAMQNLLTDDLEENTDLLTILLGRILQITERSEIGDATEAEVKGIALFVYDKLVSIDNDEVRHAMLEVLRYLPARTSNEIQFVLKLAEGTNDERVQSACAAALRRARPETPQAEMAMKSAVKSDIEIVRIAISLRLREQTTK